MEVRISRDPLVGVGHCYKPREYILMALRARGLHYLMQGGKGSFSRIRNADWKNVDELAIVDNLGAEWNDCIISIRKAGLSLMNEDDNFYWTWNEVSVEVRA